MRRLAPVAAPLILCLIVTGSFWKLLTRQYTWMDHPDMANQVLPWYQFQAVSWQRGEFPLWDPHVWGGQPLVGQLQPGAVYPPNWLLFLSPLQEGRVNLLWLHLHFVLAHVFAAFACYWLCRDLGRTRAASVLAGAAFALSGVVGSIGWPQMLHGAIWIPLVVLFFLRSTRGQAPSINAALSGAFLGFSFLSGHHQIPTFTALMMAGLWVAELWRRRAQALKPLGAFSLFAGLVSAAQVLPAYEYGLHSIRWVGSQNPVFWGQYVPYAVHQQNSLHPLGVLGFVLPNVLQHATFSSFIGLTVLTLAAMGLAAGFSHYREVRLLSAVCGGSLVFAMGTFSVFHGMAYLFVPLVEKARTPAMAIVIAQFALAVLAAYGLDALRAGKLGRWWIPGLAALGALAWAVLVGVAVARPQALYEYQPSSVLAMVALALAGILYGRRSGHLPDRAAVSLIIVLALFELGTVVGSNYHHREAPAGHLARLAANADIVAFLRRQPEPVRVEIDTDAVPYNIGDWEGIDQFRAFLGGLTTNVARFETERLKGGRLAAKIFALNYYLGKKPLHPAQELVLQGRSGVNVYRNPEAFPRAWTVHQASRVQIPDLIARLESTDLRNQVFVPQEPPVLENCDSGNDRVQLISRDLSRIAIQATMACRGMVVVSETFFPGWQATVDGSSTPVYEAYGALRGVVVGEGAHRIEMRYRPATVYAGAALTLLGVLALAVWASFAMRSKKMASAPDGIGPRYSGR